MNTINSTYRLQFHKDFTFVDFEQLIPYFQSLGISTIYASPVFESVPGSVHGYDSVNPGRINPEIGTPDQLKAISRQLRERGMTWIQDIVPNHMAFDPHNSWLMDVLEKGVLSPYASYFDIDWHSPVHEGRLMVPFLGDSLDDVIGQGALKVTWQDDKLALCYADTAYPMHLRSYASVLRAKAENPGKAIGDLLQQIDETLTLSEPDAYARQSGAVRQTLARLTKNAADKVWLDDALTVINAKPLRIRQIADEQAYALCCHSETDQQINYRRFFTVNALICLNIQDPAVFDHVHALSKELLDDGVFQGLRVDHIDGLYDPTRYLTQLRELAGDGAYIVVEKILQNNEELPAYWPVQGATGYAYLSMVNNLFTRTGSEAIFTRFYQSLLGEKTVVREELHDKKAYILYQHMNGELDNLVALFRSLHLIDQGVVARVTPDHLKSAIGEFLIQCPVYRYYGNQMPLNAEEAAAVRGIFERVRTHKPELTGAAALLEEALLQKPQPGHDDYNGRALRFYQRCMQFTGPLTAKGVEDTLMYTYTRFIGHDEVGDSPDYFGLTADAFHQKMIDRQATWPLALNATSTHDTKRGEDVRSRLNVLTELADEWVATVRQWQHLNQDLRRQDRANTDLPDEGAPDPNDEYFIYQTLVGAYPMPGLHIGVPSTDETEFPDRLTEYLEKAMREAKRNTTYDAPNESYEDAVKSFALQLLDPNRPFWTDFRRFHRRVADFGIINSLAQVVLKCTCPGLPDIYQGCEGWDLSLVDPDNRRPVDFALRRQWLDDLLAADRTPLWPNLWASRYDARIKLWLLRTLLTERSRQPDLFREGTYRPLTVDGPYSQHVLAFARHHLQHWYVVAVPLGLAQLCSNQQKEVLELDWQDTRIGLPTDAPQTWRHCWLPTAGLAGNGVSIADLFSVLPVAVIRLETVPDAPQPGNPSSMRRPAVAGIRVGDPGP